MVTEVSRKLALAVTTTPAAVMAEQAEVRCLTTDAVALVIGWTYQDIPVVSWNKLKMTTLRIG